MMLIPAADMNMPEDGFKSLVRPKPGLKFN